MWRKLTVAACLVLTAAPAAAYIGPGVGAGMIATVLGILTAIALAIFAVVWYPLKRLFKRNTHPKAPMSIDDPKER
jgi:flagellar motor component MotA